MNIIRNEKGMTLIEIVITLLIASIIMMMAGSILLSSMGFFDQHAISDMDKSTLDSAFGVVSDRIEYATGVRISETSLRKEEEYDDWRYYRINQGKVYAQLGDVLSGEDDLYTNDFYHKRTFTMKVQRKGKDKLYLYMGIKDGDNVVYDRSRTLTLENLTALVEKDSTNGIIAPTDNVYTDVYLYFTEKEPKGSELPTDISGTVADEMFCLVGNENSYRGDFKAPNFYKKGEFVTYNGVWYRSQQPLNVTDPTFTPNVMNTGWKRIDSFWNETSEYQKNDIIIYGVDKLGNYIYYESMRNNNVYMNPEATVNHAWKEIDEANLPKDEACRIDW